MTKSTTKRQSLPVDEEVDPEVLTFRARFDDQSPIDQVIREGARRMLQSAIDAEVESFLFRHSDRLDDQGRRLVVKNGSLPAREILTGAGALEVKQGRVRDNTPDSGKRVQFAPSVLPAYLRCSEGIEELLPWLYLKGVSTGDFRSLSSSGQRKLMSIVDGAQKGGLDRHTTCFGWRAFTQLSISRLCVSVR